MDIPITSSSSSTLIKPSIASSKPKTTSDEIKALGFSRETEQSTSQQEEVAKTLSKSALKKKKQKERKKAEKQIDSNQQALGDVTKVDILQGICVLKVGDEKPVIVRAEREMLDLSLTPEEESILKEMFKFRLYSKLTLMDLFGFQLFEHFNALEKAFPVIEKQIKDSKNEFFVRYAYLMISNLLDLKEFAPYKKIYLKDVKFFITLEAFLGRIHFVRNSLQVFTDSGPLKVRISRLTPLMKSQLQEKIDQSFGKIFQLLDLMEKMLTKEETRDYFFNRDALNFSGGITLDQGTPKDTLADLIKYTTYIEYLRDNSNSLEANFYKIVKNFLEILQKEVNKEKLFRREIKSLVSEFYSIYNSDFESIQKQATKRHNENGSALSNKQFVKVQDLSMSFFMLFFYAQNLDINYILNERVLSQLFPEFLNRNMRLDRISSSIKNMLLAIYQPDAECSSITTTTIVEDDFTKFFAKIQNEIDNLFRIRFNLLPIGDILNLLRSETEGFLHSKETHQTLKNIFYSSKNELPQLLKEITSLRIKHLEEFSAIVLKNCTDINGKKERIAQFKDKALKSSLNLATYIMTLLDIDALGDVWNGKKNAVSQELIDYMMMESIEEMVFPKEQLEVVTKSLKTIELDESDESSDEKEDDEKETKLDSLKSMPLSSSSSFSAKSYSSFKTSKISVSYPSKGTRFDGIKPKRSALEIQRNSRRREVFRQLREMGFFSRSGRGSHTVAFDDQGRMAVVPYNLNARGTQLSIQNAVNR